jgi:hypothetical protein
LVQANPHSLKTPQWETFKIAIDEYSFNVIDTIKTKTVGFYTTLPQAILAIAKHQMLEDRTYNLAEYAEQFEATHQKLKEAILK